MNSPERYVIILSNRDFFKERGSVTSYSDKSFPQAIIDHWNKVQHVFHTDATIVSASLVPVDQTIVLNWKEQFQLLLKQEQQDYVLGLVKWP